MEFDVNWIDAQIKRYEKLKEIAADPELVAMIESMVATKGDAQHPSTPPAATHGETHEPKLATQPAAPGAERKSRRGGRPKGELKKTVTDAVLRCSAPFTGYELTERIAAGGYTFAAANPAISVNDILRKMAAKGIVRIVKEGAGSAPNVFERV